jgi:DHA1 family tetracycline resistance protein-like MFS transporter
MSESNSQSPKSAALIFIFITVLLDMLALGIIIPVLPKLVETFLSGNTARAAQYLGLFGTVWALMQFFCSPILGVLSDRFGRRPVILLSNFGLGLDYIFMALAPTLSWLFIGRVISGITSASIPAAGGYISDVTTPENRSKGFGILGMAFGVGFILGPALGGVLGDLNPRLPFWAAAALSLLNSFYGLLVLPESLSVANRIGFTWKRANPIGSLNLLRSHAKLSGLAVVNFLNTLAHVVLPSVFVLYAGFRYGWSARAVGLALALVGLTSGVVQGALVGPLVKRFGDERVLVLGLFFGALGFATFGVAPTGSVFWLGVPLLALWGLAGAAIQGMMTQHVGPDEQGQLQGANGSLRGIAELIGPGIFTLTFAYFIQAENNWHLPGAPFLLAAVFMLVAMVVAHRNRQLQPEKTKVE